VNTDLSQKNATEQRSIVVDCVNQNSSRSQLHDALAPLLFLILFVLFVYGSLIVALLGFSAWFIETYELLTFAQYGDAGIAVLALCFLAGWLGSVFIIATVAHFVLRRQGRYILADKVRFIIILVLVNIFASPFILWRILRNNHPDFRHKYRQKLKRLARSKKMQERRLERQKRLHLSEKSSL